MLTCFGVFVGDFDHCKATRQLKDEFVPVRTPWDIFRQIQIRFRGDRFSMGVSCKWVSMFPTET